MIFIIYLDRLFFSYLKYLFYLYNLLHKGFLFYRLPSLIGMKKIQLFVLLSFLSCFYLPAVFAQIDNIGREKFAMNLDGNTLKIPFYANYDLFEVNSTIEKAVIVIHGTNRNADDYFENMEAAAKSAPESTENLLIVAPQFLTETDIEAHSLDAEHLYWTSGGWKSGSNSRDEATNPRPVRIPSYAVLDSLLIHLTRQFPSLSSIVLTGHSAGGQVTQRMAATSPMTDLLCENVGITMRYVVANPSSYVYMDDQRKLSNSTTEFGLPTNSCTTYNEWKYGLDDLFTYPELTGIPTIRANYKKALVTYLLGEADNNPNSSSLDTDCEASLQGEHRLERGMVYFNYLQHYYGPDIIGTHDLVTVPNVGHDNFRMYNSAEGIEVLFERTRNACGSTVSIQEFWEGLSFSIFPNPSATQLNVKSSLALNNIVQLSVFDLHGRLVLTKEAIGVLQMDISSLNHGLYLLAIQTKKRTFFRRFVKN